MTNYELKTVQRLFSQQALKQRGLIVPQPQIMNREQNMGNIGILGGGFSEQDIKAITTMTPELFQSEKPEYKVSGGSLETHCDHILFAFAEYMLNKEKYLQGNPQATAEFRAQFDMLA